MSPPVEQRVRVRVRRKRRRRHRRTYLRWLALIPVLLIIAVAAAVWTGLPAIGAAQDARAQVSAIDRAVQQLRDAPSTGVLRSLDRSERKLDADLGVIQRAWNVWGGPALFVSGLAPHIHAQLEQIAPLVDYGRLVAQAGRLLNGPVGPFLTMGHGHGSLLDGHTVVADLAAARHAFGAAAGLLRQARTLRRRIVARDLPASLQQGIQQLDPVLVQAPSVLQTLVALPAALGADGPRDYLVVPQNSEDLRATGGFIGTVGILHVDHGRAQLMDVQDSYHVDLGRRPNVDPPLPLGTHGWLAWYFRDANWSANYPTTAQLLEIFYRLGTGRHVDGVIAFDSLLLPALLGLSGPVAVPGYPEVLTAANAFARIDYQFNVLQNRAFVAAAYLATFERLLSLPRTATSAALTLARDSVAAHHLLLYANDPAVEHALRLAGADGAINRTTSDYLYVVDTNVSTNKVNQFVQEEVSYHAVISPDRSILATTTLTYTNTADKSNLPPQNGEPFYGDFIRLYAPAGSTLLSTSGLNERWLTYTVHNKTQFAGYFVLPSHRTRTITFRYRVPANADPGTRYALLVQKQPGTGALPLRIEVSAAPGVRLGGGAIQIQTALDHNVTAAAPEQGGTPQVQDLMLSPADPPVVPGSEPEPWVTVPTRSVAPY